MRFQAIRMMAKKKSVSMARGMKDKMCPSACRGLVIEVMRGLPIANAKTNMRCLDKAMNMKKRAKSTTMSMKKHRGLI